MNYSAFIPFLIGRVASSLSFNILSLAIGWHIYQLTGDPFDLALVGLVQIIPILSLFLVTGWVVDNFPRKLIVIICSLVDVITLFALALLMTGDQPQKEWIFVLLAIYGCARAFVGPAQQAILPNIVDEQHLSKAIAIATTTWNVASTAGPFMGGILLAFLDLDVYWTLGLFSFIAALTYSLLPKLKQTAPTGRGLEQVLGGIRFIRHNPVVLGSISLDLFIVIAGSVVALLPIYAEDILNVGAFELGLLRGMPALGAVMVGLVLSKYSKLNKIGSTLFISLAIFSASIVLFALSKTLWLSLFALWVYGASDMISVNVRTTLVQFATPDELRGRVSAVNSLFIATSNKIGDFRAGSVAAALPPVTTVLIGGISAFVVVGLGYLLFPSIRKLGKLEDAK